MQWRRRHSGSLNRQSSSEPAKCSINAVINKEKCSESIGVPQMISVLTSTVLMQRPVLRRIRQHQ